MCTKPKRTLVIGVAFSVLSCGSDTSTHSDGTAGSGGGSVPAAGGSSGSATGGGAGSSTGGSGAVTGGGEATGGSATGGEATGGSATGGTTAQAEAFEAQGSWLYLGPWDTMHTLQISGSSVVYTDIAGQWSSTWTIQDYDNELDRFRLVFESATGTYVPTRQSVSGTYALAGAILSVQLADGLESYPPLQSPGSCTDAESNPVEDCGLYMTQG